MPPHSECDIQQFLSRTDFAYGRLKSLLLSDMVASCFRCPQAIDTPLVHTSVCKLQQLLETVLCAVGLYKYLSGAREQTV